MTSACLTCGKEFRWNRPSIPQECCSRSCASSKPGRTKGGPKPKPRVIADCAWCGNPVKWAQRPGRQGKYCSRICVGRAKSKGGLSFKDGRWRVRLRDNGWQLYSRCLMEAELGRHLAYNEVVHHLNGDPTDDRMENLALMARSDHTRMHTIEYWSILRGLGRG